MARDFPGGRAPDGRAARRHEAQARGPRACRTRCRRAKAPRSSMRSGRVIGRITSGSFGPSVGAPDRDGLCRDRIRSRRHRARRDGARRGARPSRSRRCPSCRIATNATHRSTHMAELRFTEESRMAARRRRRRDRRHHQIRGRAAGRRRLRRAARSAGKKVAAGGEVAVVESVKAASEIYAPVSGEVDRIQRRDQGRSRQGQRRSRRRRLVLPHEGLGRAASWKTLMTKDQYDDFVKTL